MRRLLMTIAILSLALPALAGHSRYGGGRGFTVNIDDDEDGIVTDCGQIHVSYDSRDVPMISEDLPVGGLRSLKISSDRNGGIHVNGGAARYAVTVCKASAFGDPRDIRVRLDGNEI